MSLVLIYSLFHSIKKIFAKLIFMTIVEIIQKNLD